MQLPCSFQAASIRRGLPSRMRTRTHTHTHAHTQALTEYNETNAVMDLVLFEDAMKHICRISRIISNPRCAQLKLTETD
jgi:hypothetical protein